MGRNSHRVPTPVNPELAVADGCTRQMRICLSFIETFVAPMETELGVKSTHSVGRSHGSIDTSDYKNRIRPSTRPRWRR